MIYNFDEIIEREDTGSVKYDMRKVLFGTEDVIPMWVADMDFASPDFISDAIKQRADHPVYGYTFRTKSFNDSIVKWMKERHSWDIDPDWISFSPGIVPALNMLVLAYSDPGDGILVQPPVYYPFFRAVEDHQRKIITNELIYSEGKYTIDFDDFELKAKSARIFILCHPHNPVGRVWREEEISAMVKICRENNVIIVADEIHSDLILEGHCHMPVLFNEDSTPVTIACYSPSKTFNLAGLSTSFLLIPDKEIRKKYEKTLNDLHIGLGNLFGFVALEAAYNHGGKWLDELLQYLNANVSVTQNFLNTRIPEIKLVKPEATYLMWLDFSELGLNDKELRDFIINEAGLGLNDGPVFGSGGSGFQRMNIALPKQKLESALMSLERAVRNTSG